MFFIIHDCVFMNVDYVDFLIKTKEGKDEKVYKMFYGNAIYCVLYFY